MIVNELLMDWLCPLWVLSNFSFTKTLQRHAVTAINAELHKEQSWISFWNACVISWGWLLNSPLNCVHGWGYAACVCLFCVTQFQRATVCFGGCLKPKTHKDRRQCLEECLKCVCTSVLKCVRESMSAFKKGSEYWDGFALKRQDVWQCKFED